MCEEDHCALLTNSLASQRFDPGEQKQINFTFYLLNNPAKGVLQMIHFSMVGFQSQTDRSLTFNDFYILTLIATLFADGSLIWTSTLPHGHVNSLPALTCASCATPVARVLRRYSSSCLFGGAAPGHNPQQCNNHSD